MFRRLIFTGKLPWTDNAEEEGHHTDGKVTESSGRFEENTNELDAINVVFAKSHQMKRLRPALVVSVECVQCRMKGGATNPHVFSHHIASSPPVFCDQPK